MDEELDELMNELVDWMLEENPLFGTALGLHEYDHLLPDGSRDAVIKNIEITKEFQRRFEQVDSAKLSFSKKVEREAMLQAFRIWLFSSEEYRQWESRPFAIDVLGASIFRIYAMDFAPLEERLLSITSRIQKAPNYLEESKSRITKPVKLWVELEVESSKRFPAFLDQIYETAESVLDSDRLETLREAIQDAKDSLLSYGRWMEETLLPNAEEENRLGEEKLRKLIELKNLGLSVDEIRSLGQEYLDSFKKELERLADIVKPGATVDEIRDRIKSNHPESFDLVIEEYRKSIERSKKFVEEKGLVTLPRGEELKVVETPPYLRNTVPFAAYYSPTRFDEKKTGVYMVTPIEDKPEMMKEHSYAGIMNTTVHEGYPGHHLQLTMERMNPSMVPMIVHSTDTVEGWAHYCEDWMKEEGFDDTPETRFIQTIDLVWRAARIIVDVDLHSKKMNLDQAVDFLVDNVGMERPSAEAEVKRYTMNPAYQLCYLIGKHLIDELREDVRKRMKDKYNDKFFHDTFLSAGSLPVLLIRQIFEHKLQEMGLPPQG